MGIFAQLMKKQTHLGGGGNGQQPTQPLQLPNTALQGGVTQEGLQPMKMPEPLDTPMETGLRSLRDMTRQALGGAPQRGGQFAPPAHTDIASPAAQGMMQEQAPAPAPVVGAPAQAPTAGVPGADIWPSLRRTSP